MSHTDIIIIVATLSFASTFGVYAVIRKINHYTSPPVNTLHWTGDLELQEVIDPIQHINVRDIDLSSLPQYPQAMVNSNHLSIGWDYPPRYSQLVNSPLELDSWNFILWLLILLVLIAFIIFKYWILNSFYDMSIMIPFSFFEIDYRDSFEWEFNSYRVKAKISYLKIQTLTQDLISLLNSLKEDENYSMSLSFILSYKKWKDDKKNNSPLFIDDAIIVNKESDTVLITQFIMSSLNEKDLFLNKALFNDNSINTMEPVILTVMVPIKVQI